MMIKVKYIFYLLFWIISIQSCNAQQKVNSKPNPDTMYNFNLTKDFETFDSVRYQNIYNTETSLAITFLADSTNVFMRDGKLSKSYTEPPPHSYFKFQKIYYPNGNIKMKGVAYYDYFQAGIWYEFDEAGKLVKETDYDSYFAFDFGQVLDFCKQNNILLKKALVRDTSISSTIRREIKEGKSWWRIEWKTGAHSNEMAELDGNTGEILRHEAYGQNQEKKRVLKNL